MMMIILKGKALLFLSISYHKFMLNFVVPLKY